MKPWMVLALVFVTTGAAQAQPPSVPAPRTEVPIRDVVLSDGAHRYAVPIRIGGTQIEAGLDTGSPGLRVLSAALPAGDAKPADDGALVAEFGSGTTLQGPSGTAQVSIGGVTGQTALQLVKHAGCAPDHPQCPAGAIPAAQFGILGDGLPGEGFKALLGLSMATTEPGNPLVRLGVKRWIIELPRPGEGLPGRLILNPSDAEVASYVRLPIVASFSNQQNALHDAILGCFSKAATREHFCGALTFDTGTPGIQVLSPKVISPPWADGTVATLLFQDSTGRVQAVERLVIGVRSHASHLTFTALPAGGDTLIAAGLTPYFAYSVLYDAEQGLIGFKPRTPSQGGPQALSLAPAGVPGQR